MDGELLDQFIGITGASKDVAEQFLEASKGDLDIAVSAYFENSISENEIERSPSPIQSSSHQNPFSQQSSQGKPKSKPSSSSSRIATFSDYQKGESSDEEGAQEFFAGGKASGVALQGPSNAQKPTQNIIGNILKTAEENGRQEQQEQQQTKKPKTFLGSGYRLGDENDENIPSQPITQNQQGGGEEEDMEELSYTLTFWEDGFSIDDGPLRNYQDPANQEFLKTLSLGLVPQELKAKLDQKVKIVVQHKVREKYVPPKKVLKPFSGAGNRLGSEIPGEPQPQLQSNITQSSLPSSSSSTQTPQINSNEPVTTIQIRLADGTRMVAKFNHTQQVSALYSFVRMSRSGESRPFVLMTTFPNKELTEESQTLQEAGLLNAVVVQKYK